VFLLLIATIVWWNKDFQSLTTSLLVDVTYGRA